MQGGPSFAIAVATLAVIALSCASPVMACGAIRLAAILTEKDMASPVDVGGGPHVEQCEVSIPNPAKESVATAEAQWENFVETSRSLTAVKWVVAHICSGLRPELHACGGCSGFESGAESYRMQFRTILFNDDLLSGGKRG